MKFSHLIIVFALLIGLCSCESSKEEKAQQKIEEYLKGYLHHPDSYVPLQTKVDSAFISLITDKETVDLTRDMFKMIVSLKGYMNKIDRAQSSMEIWTPDRWSTEFQRGEYNRAKKERDENQRLFDKTRERLKVQFEKIKTRQSEINEGDFIGWKVYHKYKSLNGAGTSDLFEEGIFFCDQEFNIESAYSKEDFDALTKIMEVISNSEDLIDFCEKLEECIF